MSEIETILEQLRQDPDRVDLRHRLIRLYLERADSESMQAAAEELSLIRLLRPS